MNNISHLNLLRAGLVRSLGGWSEVFALRGRGEKQRSDQRILGDREFVQDVIFGLDDLQNFLQILYKSMLAMLAEQ